MLVKGATGVQTLHSYVEWHLQALCRLQGRHEDKIIDRFIWIDIITYNHFVDINITRAGILRCCKPI